MELQQRFQQNWQQQFCHLSPSNCCLLLAVSGGVDSVVLTELLHRSGFAFTVAHCNFQLRGEESERDEQFVRTLAEKYKKPLLVKRFDTKNIATQQKISVQEAARELRYAWFAELIGRETPEKDAHLPSDAYILTAHHADDNIETVLMHFFRGTGIQGLTGIQPLLKEKKIIRPLLPFTKKELLAYAADHQLPYVEDSSNASDKYTRNYFRNQLIPQIREVYPQVEKNLADNIDRLGEAALLYQQAVAQQLSKLVERKGTEFHIPVLKWKKACPLHTLTWELIRPFGFHAAQTGEVIRLLDGENGAYQSSATHRIIRNRNWMIIAPNAAEAAQHLLIEEDQKQLSFADGLLAIKSVHHLPLTIPQDPQEALLDRACIRFPLLLRKWRTGDYFYPLGMDKKKKISRFLIDLKLSPTEKEKVWVLESDRKILWVIGYRIDNRCKVTAKTMEALAFVYRK